MQIKTQGLVIKEQVVGESDRLVTVLTKDEGMIRAFARKAKNLRDSKSSATQLLCYSRLNIYKGRDKYIINEAFPVEVFFGLRKDVHKLALAQYFCELALELVPEGVDASEFLRVLLNALHFLCSESKTDAMIKSIVELRMMAVAGYMPNLVCCANCGKFEDERMYLIIDRAVLYCQDCFIKSEHPYAILGTAALRAMRHIVFSEIEKLFSFTVTAGAQRELSAATEAYLIYVIQKRPKTLDFYRSLM